jgi:VanZ family protein
MKETPAGRLVFAILTAAAVIFFSPWIGEARSWLRRTIPTHFNVTLNFVLAAIALAVLAITFARIRDRRAMRYAALIAAAGLAAWVAIGTASASPAQNAVERFHFVEYGLVTALFYRAWRPRGDPSIVLLPLIAGLIVGTLDEAWQWFVPERVGEWRDIFLNFGAIGTGLLMSLAMAPPVTFTARFARGSWSGVCLLTAAAVLALAAFMQLVHLGYVVRDDEVGTFRSRYTADELLTLSANRAATWRVTPPPTTLQRFSREDQYLAEALWHVRARNDAWDADVGRAWGENRVLEKFFGPVLDVRSYLTPAGVKWPDAQRADAQRRVGRAPRAAFESHAGPANFVLPWPRQPFWAAVMVLVVGLIGAARLSGSGS